MFQYRTLYFLKKERGTQIPVARAEATVEVYRRIKGPQMQANERQKSRNELIWNPAPGEWFKVNTDAAIQAPEQRVGLGIIIRDSKGSFVAAAMKKSKFYDNIAYSEAEATNLGIEVAESAAIHPLIFETNCLEVVNQISRKRRNKSELPWILSEV